MPAGEEGVVGGVSDGEAVGDWDEEGKEYRVADSRASWLESRSWVCDCAGCEVYRCKNCVAISCALGVLVPGVPFAVL